ncbi:diaminopimelate decarboxylase [Jatrophihabitans sp. YIM 134969]
MTLADIIPSLRSSLPHPLEPWLWPSSTRHVPGGDLSVGGVRLAAVAREYGTPVNVLDTGEFRVRCDDYRHAYRDGEVAYAGKALLTRAVVRIVEAAGLALDVCSAGELELAISEYFPPERLILHGNAKTDALLRRATAVGVGRIVVDSIDEIGRVAATARGGNRQPVLVRLTPGVDAGTHAAITTGTEDQKFGLSIASGAAAAAVRRILDTPELQLVGVHCHLGSQITRVEPYQRAVRRIVEFLATVRDLHGVEVPQLDLGGGHGIAYHPGDVPLPPLAMAAAVRTTLAAACRAASLRVPRLTVEPGRAIAGPSGVTLYTVVGVKHTPDHTWVAVDGGMADNPRPALYDARYTARLLGRLSPARDEHVTVVGRHCEAGDVLIRDALLPGDVRAGDLLVVPATGAYHHAMASNYNHTPRPPLVAVERGVSRVLVRRETFDDLVSRDVG